MNSFGSPKTVYPSYAHAVAGAGGGLATAALLHPLDTLRTRLQSVSEKSHRARPGDALRVFRSIVVREGAHALYRGIVPASLGSVVSWGCYFHWFYKAQDVISPHVAHETGAHLMAGTVAGAMTSLVTNPIWVVKVRLQLQSESNLVVNGAVQRPYRGFMDGLCSIAREEGVRGLYRGLGPSLWLVSHGALQFTLYEKFKGALREGEDAKWDRGSGPSVRHSLMASTGSKLVASVATYPLQVARTRMQERFADGDRYGKFVSSIGFIFRTEGLRGLYRGLSANIARVTPQAAVTFVTYEQILRLFALQTER